MSTDEAVQRGISTTAGTVTSAALVMVGVFLVFVTLAFLDFKELGLGLAAAVLIDATIIRGVLLPATMKLLGDWNWYLPAGSSGCRTSRPAAMTPRPRRTPRALPPDKPGTAEEPEPHPSGLAKMNTPTTPGSADPPPAGGDNRGWSAGRVVAVVVGSMARSSVWPCCSRAWHWCLLRRLPATTTATTSDTERLSTPTYALTVEDIDLGSDPVDFVPKDILGRVRIEAERPGGGEVVGIGPEREVDAYLRGVGHAEVDDLSDDPPRYLTRRGGTPTPALGGAVLGRLVGGPGRQAVDWEVEGGRWSVVAMNADGARRVVVDGDVAAKVGWFLGVGIGLLAAGLILVAGGIR